MSSCLPDAVGKSDGGKFEVEVVLIPGTDVDEVCENDATVRVGGQLEAVTPKANFIKMSKCLKLEVQLFYILGLESFS